MPRGGEAPVLLSPDVGLYAQLAFVSHVDVEPAGLAATVRARLPEAGGDRDDGAVQRAGRDLELMPLRDGRLVDVAGEDQLGAGVHERGEHVRSPRDGFLARAPGRADQVVMERDDAKRTIGCSGEQLGGVPELAGAQPARLVPPRPNGVEADGEKAVGAVNRLCCLPLPLELSERMREPSLEGPRDVVVARDHEQRPLQPSQKVRRTAMLLGPSAVCQVAGGDYQSGVGALDEGAQRTLDFRLLDGADVKVREVEEPCGHRRRRLVH